MSKLKLVINNDFKKHREKFFIKRELQCILNLYAKMVSNGSWKDYSFTSGFREISFDVYQRASDKPVLRITKNLKPNYYNERFLIKDRNGNVIQKSEDLNNLIKKTSWNSIKLIK
tara:strand:+ start:688 stop:1032 length:345 start_codon:yes stop_codon:yes gene_type:complete